MPNISCGFHVLPLLRGARRGLLLRASAAQPVWGQRPAPKPFASCIPPYGRTRHETPVGGQSRRDRAAASPFRSSSGSAPTCGVVTPGSRAMSISSADVLAEVRQARVLTAPDHDCRRSAVRARSIAAVRDPRSAAPVAGAGYPAPSADDDGGPPAQGHGADPRRGRAGDQQAVLAAVTASSKYMVSIGSDHGHRGRARIPGLGFWSQVVLHEDDGAAARRLDRQQFRLHR